MEAFTGKITQNVGFFSRGDLKKRSQSVNVKHRKISFGDFQTETIGISVKKILIEVPICSRRTPPQPSPERSKKSISSGREKDSRKKKAVFFHDLPPGYCSQ